MPGKKIIVACDGTWVDGDNGFHRTSNWFSSDVEGVLAVPSNVTRFCRALKSSSADGRPQLTYYQAGLGSAQNWYSYYVGGYLGEGLSENIREAYAFVCNNYEDGDEIYLVGFSRGAFTARSIGGLIDAIGLLTKKGLADFYTVFRDWEHQNDSHYFKPDSKGWIKAINIPEPRLDYGNDKKGYVQQLVKNGLTRPNVPVEATAVWDTVGSLGIPSFVVPPFSWFQNAKAPKAYAFINTEIPRNLRYAYQALALDERRTPFAPTIWELPEDIKATQLQELKQCWFAGCHSNVGSSYPDTGIANLTLAWILQQLSDKLTFDSSYIPAQRDEYVAWSEKNKAEQLKAYPEVPRPWSCSKVYSSASAVQDFLVGASDRTPGTYRRLNPITGKETKTPLRKTHEFIHPSVRVRAKVLDGPGTGDAGKYNDTFPLKQWILVEPKGQYEAKKALKGDLWGPEFEDSWKWVKQANDGTVTWIAEAKMEGVEWGLVDKKDKAYNAILATKSGK